MQLRLLSWLVLCASLAVFSLRAQAQVPAAPGSLTQPGTVLVAKVNGDVTMVVNGATTALKVDDRVPQMAKITTALNSSVVLVFSNGATTQLGPDTELVLEEFLQDPFADTIKVADLTEEPTPSRTKLDLKKGELVGNVKKLKYSSGSSFTVQTPVGAAGIRGTTFRIVFRPTGSGQAFGGGAQNFQFSLSTLEGDVGFAQGATGGATPNATPGAPTQNQGAGGQTPAADPNATPGGGGGSATTGTTSVQGISVPTGQEIVVTVTATQNAQGQLVLSAPPAIASTVTMPPNVAAAVSAAAQDIVSAVVNTTFTPAPPAASGSQGAGSSSGTGTQGGEQGNSGSSGTSTNEQGSSGGGPSGTTTSSGPSGSTGNAGGGTGSTGSTGSTPPRSNSLTNNQTPPTTAPAATPPPPRLTPGG